MAKMMVLGDGVLERHVEIDSQGEAHSNILQPSRGMILDEVAEMRKNPDALKHAGWAGLELVIPLADMEYLKRVHPGLTSRDRFERRETWRKLLRQPFMDIYRVRERKRA